MKTALRSPRARRLPPDLRRVQILDSAVALIVSTGHSSVTLEQVAAAAGISKPLIYKYFPRREDLLKAILEREFADLSGRGLDTIPRDIPIERVIRGTVERALHYYAERGPIVRLLSADPALAGERCARGQSRLARLDDGLLRPALRRDLWRAGRRRGDRRHHGRQRAHYLPMASIRRRGISADLTIEVWSEFILGGWKALEVRFRTRRSKN